MAISRRPSGRRIRRAVLGAAVTLSGGGALWLVPAGTAAAGAAVAPAVSSPAVSSPAVSAPAVVTPAPSPAYAGDAGDPDVVQTNGQYVAFSTGTALGNHLQALVDTSGSPSSGYRSYTGLSYGSTALATPPAWETANTQTSPGAIFLGGRWLLYYDAAPSPQASDTGHDCLSVAVGGTTLSTASPQFTDTSTGPLLCQPTGSIDPSPFLDPATGQAYLLWKQNDGGSSAPAALWSQQLSANGLSLVGQPSQLLYNDTAAYPWEATVEDPQMVAINGVYELLFSAGIYTSAGYSEAIATCTGPLGPCGAQSQILTSYGSALGPGGGSAFQSPSGAWSLGYAAWQGGSAGCTSYACGATRQLFVAPISFAATSLSVPCSAPRSPSGYDMVGTDGGVFTFGNLPFCGSTGAISLNQPVVGIALSHDGGGYWTVARDGGVFAFGDAASHGSLPGLSVQVSNVVGIDPTPDGGGYLMVGNDGGMFAFGDAQFHGSLPGLGVHVSDIVGIVPSHDGGGYLMVGADGGVFAFGDAPFRGSLPGLGVHVSDIVGIVPSRDGGGYLMVGADGGVFAFGDAPFAGSLPGDGVHVSDIVGIEPSADDAGYLMVGADGGVFAFGDAPFAGSLPGDGVRVANIVALAGT